MKINLNPTKQSVHMAVMALSGLLAQASPVPTPATLPVAAKIAIQAPKEERRLACAAVESTGGLVPSVGIQRSPYQAERVYKIRCVPGAPIMVELPMGEEADTIYYDKLWWKADSIPGSNRVTIQAVDASGIRGRRSNIHIETAPSKLRISFQVEAVGEDQEPPSVISIYLDGNDFEAKTRVQARAQALQETGQFKKALDADMKASFEAWKAKTVSDMKDGYKFEKGKLGLERVVSDGTQTFITIKTTEQPALKLRNRDDKEETLNYEVKEGVFIVNHVLLEGEAFVLVVGKETATIRPK